VIVVHVIVKKIFINFVCCVLILVFFQPVGICRVLIVHFILYGLNICV